MSSCFRRNLLGKYEKIIFHRFSKPKRKIAHFLTLKNSLLEHIEVAIKKRNLRGSVKMKPRWRAAKIGKGKIKTKINKNEDLNVKIPRKSTRGKKIIFVNKQLIFIFGGLFCSSDWTQTIYLINLSALTINQTLGETAHSEIPLYQHHLPFQLRSISLLSLFWQEFW